MGAGGRAGRWAQARIAGVQTGAQGVLALGVGADAHAAGGRGAQTLGRQALRRAGRAGVSGRAGGRALQTVGRRAGARQQARRADARACRGALAALRHGSLALRHGQGALPRHSQAAHDTATSTRPVRAGWGFVHSDSVFGPGSTRYISGVIK